MQQERSESARDQRIALYKSDEQQQRRHNCVIRARKGLILAIPGTTTEKLV